MTDIWVSIQIEETGQLLASSIVGHCVQENIRLVTLVVIERELSSHVSLFIF